MKKDESQLRFTTPEMIYMLENQEKLERIEYFLKEFREHLFDACDDLFDEDSQKEGFFKLGALCPELAHFIGNEFPEGKEKEEPDEEQEKCCSELPY